MFAAFVLAAALLDPSVFQDLHWRLIGPFRAGRVLAVSGVPGQPQHFYFGSVNGGVWETINAGRTWKPVFDSQPIGSIGALAIAPSNPNVIYVGSGEADMRSDISQGDGMYKSTDGGKSWTHIGLADSQQIGRVIVHPANPDLVYVAALGHPYAANRERGVFRSADGGATWTKILGGGIRGPRPEARGLDQDTGAIDLAFEPGNPRIIYAALWQTRRTPWSVYPPSNGAGSGLFKSTDGGDSWTELHVTAKPGRIGVAVAPSQPARVYAIVDAEAGGMYRSDDRGATWTRVASDSRIWSRGWYFGQITVEPKNADVVYSCNVNLYRSADAGVTWAPVKGAPGGDDYHQLWIDPDHPERRILGVDQGTVVSVDNGATWSSWFNQPTGQFYHVITDNRFPYWVYGSQQDSGAAGVPSRTSEYDGISMTEFREITAGGESDNVAPDPKDPEVLYGGRVERLDMRTHQTQNVDPTFAYPNVDRRTWTLPLVFSPRDPRVLYFSNQRLFRTEDGGKHWTIISPDLTREDPGTPANLDPATAALKPGGPRLGVIYTIAPSRLADHDLWAGTDDGLIWRTLDEGAHWTNITPPALTAWSKVGIIETSHFDPQTAYAAIDRHRLDDFKPYVYRTHDGGKTWQLAANGIGTFVNVVREDPVRRGLLYAGSEKGVFVSFDDGDHWQPLQLNLPVTSVRDIDVHGNDLVIATHGRAFWILDDVTPLRHTANGSPFLFPPATAIRVRPAGFTGTPMPKDEPLAANPPNGAYIDYVVPASAGPITLEIFDSNNQLVRRYGSDDPVPRPNPAKLRTAPEWFDSPSTVATTAGMHRFVWPIRYPAPKELDEAHRGAYADGVWAPPGIYKVALTVNGQTLTEPLTIASDPRIDAPASAYAEQLALAREIESLRAPIHKALDDAEELMKTVKDEAVKNRLRDIADVVPEDQWWLAPRSTSSLRFVDSKLQELARAVDGADAAPTPDMRAGWAKLKPIAESVLQSWRSFQSSR
jgi:photosystem II stability/assembly factor-like uncharacterized protein